jgi:hypothetical protein
MAPTRVASSRVWHDTMGQRVVSVPVFLLFEARKKWFVLPTLQALTCFENVSVVRA